SRCFAYANQQLTPTHPSLFSPFGRETVPAQSSTGFLAQHPRLFPLGFGRAGTNALPPIPL
ncbi:MAG: hypothetical protein AB1715_11905, partial [Acidobacteriota bacterium]